MELEALRPSDPGQMLAGVGVHPPPQEGLRRAVLCLAGSICRDLLPLVQCPTLIVHGEKDPLVPRFHADFLHRHVRGSR